MAADARLTAVLAALDRFGEAAVMTPERSDEILRARASHVNAWTASRAANPIRSARAESVMSAVTATRPTEALPQPAALPRPASCRARISSARAAAPARKAPEVIK